MLASNVGSHIALEIGRMVTKRALKLLLCLVYAKKVAMIPEALTRFEYFVAILAEEHFCPVVDCCLLN